MQIFNSLIFFFLALFLILSITDNDSQPAVQPASPKEGPNTQEVMDESKLEEKEDTVAEVMDGIKEDVTSAMLLVPPTLNPETGTPEAEEDEMEVQLEHNEILQQSS